MLFFSKFKFCKISPKFRLGTILAFKKSKFKVNLSLDNTISNTFHYRTFGKSSITLKKEQRYYELEKISLSVGGVINPQKDEFKLT